MVSASHHVAISRVNRSQALPPLFLFIVRARREPGNEAKLAQYAVYHIGGYTALLTTFDEIWYARGTGNL